MATTFKIGEHDLDFLVLYILLRYPNINTSQLKNLIWQYTQPAGVNLTPLVGRNDAVIDQIVRNIVSHRYDSANNIIYRGLVSYNGYTLNITPAGLAELDNYIKEKCFL